MNRNSVYLKLLLHLYQCLKLLLTLQQLKLQQILKALLKVSMLVVHTNLCLPPFLWLSG